MLNRKHVQAIIAGFVLLTFIVFSAHAQDGDIVYLPLVVGPLLTPTSTLSPTATHAPTSVPTSIPGNMTVDLNDKQSVLAFYMAYHEAAPHAEMGWTGNHENCDPGTTSSAYQQSLQNLVNYFRSMAGVPAEVTFNAEYIAKAQKAALMMSVNRQLSHNPPADWRCYTQEGAEAAGSSNLSYWFGTGGSYHGIKGQMRDNGAGNYAVGHRRWILCPMTKEMGTGDVPAVGNYYAANSLWVFDQNLWGPRPPVRDTFVAWPPAGYVPAPVVYNRWSFMWEQADFSTANVVVRYNGAALDVQKEQIQNGYCENTFVWIPNIDWTGLDQTQDHVFQVEITGVKSGGETRTFAYEVKVFFP